MINCDENTDELMKYVNACGIEKKYDAIFILCVVFFKNAPVSRSPKLSQSLSALNRTANNTLLRFRSWKTESYFLQAKVIYSTAYSTVFVFI